MYSLAILAVGIAIVIGGILAWRLHAFVALVLAGLTVAILTPSHLVRRSALLEKGYIAADLSRTGDSLTVAVGETAPSEGIVFLDAGRDVALERIGIFSPAASEQLTRRTIEVTREVSESDRLLLVSSATVAASDRISGGTFLSRHTTTLGEYCGKLAILIVAASIIGRCLLDSGAADEIVGSTMKVLGEGMAPAAFLVSGFVLGIPVFFDTVFYLMIPLGKALRLRTGGNYLLYVLSIVAGGTMAHSLVPPTPGPLFIAEEFGIPLGRMILGGTIVGGFAGFVGMLYAFWANRRFELPLRDFDESHIADSAKRISPGLFASLVPILLPVVLITAGSLLEERPAGTFLFAGWSVSPQNANAIKTLSEKNLALLISAAFAVVMYVRTQKPSKDVLAESLQKAVSSAGTIILVTAAGGAFGRMMRQTAVAELLQDLPSSSPVMLVVAAFLVTTAVRTAQGSATVAMLTSAGVFSGIVAGGAAGVDPLYVALAVGCGSKPIAWMNDSGFWVITRMSGMTEAEGLKYVTPMTSLAGVAGLVAVIFGVIVFP